MNRLLLIVVLSLGCSPPRDTVVIRGGHWVDVEAGTLRPLGELIMRDGRIAALHELATDPAPTDVDATGKVLVPGLWDLHVHLGGEDPNGTNALPPLVWDTWRGSRYKRFAFLEHGVTTLRDLGGTSSIDLRTRLERGDFVGPHLFAAGRIVTSRDGHPVGTIGKAVPWIADALGVEVTTADEANRAVDREVASGVDLVKLVFSSGVPGTPWPLMTEEALDATVERAHASGKRVSVHINHAGEAVTALSRGVEPIEHAPLLEENDAAAQPFVDALAARGTCWVPTLVVIRQAFPDSLDAAAELVGRASSAGVRLGAGTDAPNGLDFGASLVDEVRLLETKAGLSPAAALRAATSDAAKCAGRDGEGVLREGAAADLVMLDADPLESTEALKRVREVWLAGRSVARK